MLPKDKGVWPLKLLTEPINGKKKFLIDISDFDDKTAERKFGHVVCAVILIAVFCSCVYSSCSWYFDHISPYLFQISKYVR